MGTRTVSLAWSRRKKDGKKKSPTLGLPSCIFGRPPRRDGPERVPAASERPARRRGRFPIHRRSAVAPLQGFFPRFSLFFASPGRCPGLICPAPSGPKPQTARHQNAYAGSSRLHDRPNWSDYGVPFLEASQGTFSKYALLSDAATAICLSSGLQASP